MEFPPRVVAVERALVGAFLTALVAAAAVESRSSLSWSLRRREPVPFWLALEAPDAGAPRFFWALYQPARRTLDLVFVPGAAREDEARARLEPHLPGTAPSGARVLRFEAPAWPPGEEPSEAKAWLEAGARRLSLWPAPTREAGAFEAFQLALELGRLPRGAVRPAWLPDEASRAGFLARLFAPPDPRAPDEPGVTAEVLNASSRKGLAAEATKVLRLAGADVVSYGNSEAPAVRTVVFDRTGRIENAVLVRGMLDCPSAEALTRLDAKRLVDVTVLVAEDCAGRFR